VEISTVDVCPGQVNRKYCWLNDIFYLYN